MFRHLLALALMCSFGSLIADDFSDFRIPKHSLSSLRASLDANWYNDGRTDDLSGDRYSSGSLYGGLGYNYLFDSERFALEAQANLSSGFRRYGSKYRDRSAVSASSSSYASKYVAEEIYTQFDAEYFPFQFPLGAETSIRGRTDPRQGWYHSESLSEFTDSVVTGLRDSETNEHYYFVAAGVAPQWGRVRNVSAIYDVYLLEKRLIEAGTISQELKPSTKHALAELLYRKPDYATLHSLAAKYFWKDVEALLMEDPAFQRNLDAYALYRIGESVAPRAFARRKGIRLAFLFEGRHTNSIINRTETDYLVTATDTSLTTDTLAYGSEKRIHHTDEIVIGPRFEVNLPIGWTWQVTAGSELQRSIQPAGDGFFWQNFLTVSYALSEKWYAEYNFGHTRLLDDLKDRNRQHGQSWSFSHYLLLDYYIEDRVWLEASFDHYQNYAKAYFPNVPESDYARFYDNVSARIGVRYSFWGGRGTATTKYLPRSQNMWNILSDYGPYYWGEY